MQIWASQVLVFPQADGERRVTLRSMTNARMTLLMQTATKIVAETSRRLKVNIQWHDVFRAVANDMEATEVARVAAQSIGHTIYNMPTPMRWSKDFGRFGDDGAKAAMLYIGSGEKTRQLHNPDYDFPDALLPVVVDQFRAMVDHLLE